MSAFQAIALYDFSTNVRGELSFQAKDVMIVTSTHVGNGWWEAKNAEGIIGLIPRSYFKIKPEVDAQLYAIPTSPQKSTSSSSSSTPSISLPPRPPPKPSRLQKPPFPPINSIQPSGIEPEDVTVKSNEWSTELETVPSSISSKCQNIESSTYESDNYDDDDDDDDEDMEEFKTNKFVGMMTGSTDLYLFEVNPSPLPEEVQRVSIVESDEGPVWSNGFLPPILCKVGSPTKEKKFRGIKSFITYRITPTNTNIPVCRRYKHFDWLHAQLSRKFISLLIPPLPCKQISGRFEEEFINTRLKQLEMWLMRMSIHPVISQSEVFKLFIHCQELEDWKNGKRQAERDKFKGPFFFHTIIPPCTMLDPITIELKLDKFERFIRCMDDSVKHLLGVSLRVTASHKCSMIIFLSSHFLDLILMNISEFRKEFCKLGKSFEELSKSFELDSKHESKKLSLALSYTGKTYSEVGMLFGVQPSRDLDSLVEGLTEYKGILSMFPDIMLVQRSVTNKIQETAGQMSRQDVNRIQGRANVITYTLLAEMHHFQVNRVSDFSRIMQNYLLAQIEFWKQLTLKFEQALKQYGGLS